MSTLSVTTVTTGLSTTDLTLSTGNTAAGDIVIQSDRLNLVWNNIEDYLVCQNCKDILGRHWKALEYVNRTGIKFYWATLFYFRKSDQSKEFFDRCNLIKENYEYYTKKEIVLVELYYPFTL
jgi:hypothetical protein